MLDKIDLEVIVTIAKEAGDAIMEIYDTDFQIEYKDDKSPLTEADTKSNEIICSALAKAYPEIPLLSEEKKAEAYKVRKNWEYFWLIDPIDGTKEFIKKNSEFTVNIALIHKDTPVLGVVYAPALSDMYKAKKGSGAFKNGHKLPLETNVTPEQSLKVVASKSHLSKETQAFIDEISKSTESIKQVSRGSSLKLVMVAEGSADIYPRLAPTMEWDTAAADAIVRESGKMTYQFEDDSPVVYNKENLLNPWFVVR
ncbi:MAG: 3'(2'),5'-bisphosphate nucleotidase [Sulfurovum sp.]|nr:MAG: 3'(2'),5'-bisphosphate nucleotidase [Sulfurovum sp.]